MAVVRATRLAVADMARRRAPGLFIMINSWPPWTWRGDAPGVLNMISSIAGRKIPAMGAIPDSSVYSATKYAVTALCETLRLEFSYSGLPIRVTSLSPGAVDTQMLHTVIANNPLLKDKIPMLKPKDIADAVLYVLSTPDSVNISEMTVQVTGEIV
ncbi:Farnesol dehydrogenase [Eumeta japonica]|uniref:Farnesol dehydrogenase n=1 Tax=Eumeta variegata TaxID=151549 RepID=A0A4C1Y277_EUMVA|nr:Farnesol dehydrogenase [Eumeta japonica]